MDSWVDEYVRGCDQHAWIILRDQLKLDFLKFKQVRGPAGPTLNVEDKENNRLVLSTTLGFDTKWVNVLFDDGHIRTNDSTNPTYREIGCKRDVSGNHLLILDGKEMGFKHASRAMLWPLVNEYLPS